MRSGRGLIEFALFLMFHLGNPASLVCGTWLPIANSWPPTSRDNDGTSRDWLGVEILYNHDWKTGFLWWTGSASWAENPVMHLEPAI